MVEAWSSLPAEVRAALVQSELASSTELSRRDSSFLSVTSSSSDSGSGSDDTSSEEKEGGEILEECKATGAKIVMRPLERAPENVFAFTKTSKSQAVNVEKKASGVVTTKTTVVSTSRGWRNIFSLPISYDVTIVPHGSLLDPLNPQLLNSTGVHPEEYNRRFAVIDEAIDEIHGVQIRAYFAARNIELHTVTIAGGEPAKRPDVSSLPVCGVGLSISPV